MHINNLASIPIFFISYPIPQISRCIKTVEWHLLKCSCQQIAGKELYKNAKTALDNMLLLIKATKAEIYKSGKMTFANMYLTIQVTEDTLYKNDKMAFVIMCLSAKQQKRELYKDSKIAFVKMCLLTKQQEKGCTKTTKQTLLYLQKSKQSFEFQETG